MQVSANLRKDLRHQLSIEKNENSKKIENKLQTAFTPEGRERNLTAVEGAGALKIRDFASSVTLEKAFFLLSESTSPCIEI